MKKIMNKFKAPIYKDDVNRVVLNAVISSLLIGVLSGLINEIFGKSFGMTLMIFYIMVGYFIGIRIRKSYFTYHILYPVLAVLFTFLGLMIGNAVAVMMHFNDFRLLSYGIKEFFSQLNLFSGDFYSNIWNVVNFILYLGTLVLAYKCAKGNE